MGKMLLSGHHYGGGGFLLTFPWKSRSAWRKCARELIAPTDAEAEMEKRQHWERRAWMPAALSPLSTIWRH